jgi:hypothetical protein
VLSTLREAFGVRLYEAIGDGGPLTLFIGGDQLFARTLDGQLYNLDRPEQALMMVGEELPLRPLTARERKKRTKALTGSGKSSRGRRPGAQ